MSAPEPIRRTAYVIANPTIAATEAREQRERRRLERHSHIAQCPCCFNEVDDLTAREATRQSREWDKRMERAATNGNCDLARRFHLALRSLKRAEGELTRMGAQPVELRDVIKLLEAREPS